MKKPANCALKYRLYPCRNSEILDQMLGNARFVWNAMLGRQKAHYIAMREYFGDDKETAKELGKTFYLKASECLKEITKLKKDPEFSFLNASIARTGDFVQKKLDLAWQDFFKLPDRGMPRFKSKRGTQSFQTDRTYTIDFNKGSFFLKKERFHFKIKSTDKAHGILQRGGYAKTVTVSRVPSGKYYLSVQFHDPSKEHAPSPEEIRESVGIDVGVKDLAITSDGDVFANDKLFKSNMRRLARLQKKMARQQKGSQNWTKTKARVATLHWRISNIRKNRTHDITKELTDRYDLICIEDLKVSNMTKRPKKVKREDGKGYKQNNSSRKAGLNRNMLDANFSEFRRQIEYKARWKGKKVVAINTFYPSSKTCSTCGEKNKELKLSHRHWICQSCGTKHDRDFNAAKNILSEGLRKIGHSSPKPALKGVQDCGDAALAAL